MEILEFPDVEAVDSTGVTHVQEGYEDYNIVDFKLGTHLYGCMVEVYVAQAS